MQMTNKKNISKALLVILLLFSSLFLQAQEEEKPSTVIADTTETEPPSPEDEELADDQYFTERYNDTLSVKQRNLPPAVVKKWKEGEDFWYANADIKRKKSKEQLAWEREQGLKDKKGKKDTAVTEEQQQEDNYVPLGQRSWFQTLLWVVILGVFAVGLAIYLGGSNVGLFRKRNMSVKEVEEAEITEDIFTINYQKEIDKAAAQGNFRLAIRLMFLRVLKNMSEKNIIRYKQDKTNLDYLVELHPTNHYNGFFRITRNYEYSWYGQFNVSEEAYKIIRADFDQFEATLR